LVVLELSKPQSPQSEPHMSKRTTSKSTRQPRTPRATRKATSGVEGRILNFRKEIRTVFEAEVRSAVSALAHQLVEDEVAALVGPPWSRKGDSPLRLNGKTSTTIFLDGEPHELRRRRVRDQVTGTEHTLETLDALRDRDALDEEVKVRMVRGITTRNYEGTLTCLSDGLGLKKSAVSSAFQRASQKDLDDLNGRSLSEWNFAAIFIDGTGFADHTCVIAMGVTTEGDKRILGVVEGATENAQMVGDLLENLADRGLQTTGRVLFVIDGAKALRKAIKNNFGKRALIQRCQIHKRRNIESYLPPGRQAEARRRLNAAWGLTDAEEALQALRQTHAWLQKISVSAAASLEEALEDTITVHRLGVTGALRKTLQTTNPIESANDIIKTNARRVKRWNGSAMVLRWVGTGLVRAEAQFRRVRGHKEMQILVAALEDQHLPESELVVS
jgi:putative transposase